MKSSVYSKNVFLEGQILLIDKPLGWSSFDVVKKIKHLIRKKYSLKKLKVGHAGTLEVATAGFEERLAETRDSLDVSASSHGVGRELFAGFRALAGPADEGAISLGGV